MSNNESHHIDFNKLTAYIAGEYEGEEKRLIKDWIEASAENKKLYEECLNAYHLDYSDVLFSNESDDEDSFSVDTEAAWQRVAIKAKLDGTHLEIDVDQSQILPKRQTFTWLKIAASLFIGMSILFIFKDKLGNKDITVAYTEGIHKIYLPDSSLVIMQGKSQLVYNPTFNAENRDIRLVGTAYFDIRKIESLPFIIDTDEGQVKVLGTAFLIEKTANEMIVSVERGKVNFASKASDLEDYVLLEKHDQGNLEFDNNVLTKSKLTNLNHLYWANKKLVYRQESLKQVLDELASIFEKDIQYDSTMIDNCKITGVFKDQEFEAILQNIATALQFEYNIEDESVEILSNGCNP